MIATLRGLRALMWLRWRLLKNSLAGGQKRDSVEQASRALALMVPLMIVALSAGTFLAVSALGYFGGRMMAEGILETGSGLLVFRLLLGIMAFTIVALSIMSPTQSTLSRYTRLLLLPIHRRVLHLVEVLSSIGDPWIAVVAAGLTTFSVGLYAGGRPWVALVALAAAALMVGVVICAGSLAGFLVAWLMRDRRRGELFTLVFVLVFSMLSFIPAFMSRSIDARHKVSGTESQAKPGINVEEFDRNLPRWTRYLPSEVHGHTMAAALESDRAGVVAGLVTLGVEMVLLFMASARVHRQMLGALEGDQSRRRSAEIKLTGRKWPLLSPGASAVAWALTRGSFRTVRGRLAVLLPGPMLAMLVAVFQSIPSETWTAEAATRGYLLFGASSLLAFYAMNAISMNFFGSDRAGLTLQLLSPITDQELAWGKIAGFGAVIGVGLAVCLVAAATVAHSGALAYWIATSLGAIAAFALISPMAIWFSALFPVASDLSKTGAGGNPHPFPMIAGTAGAALASLPTVGILAAAEFLLKSPLAAVLLALVWALVAIGIAMPLVTLASRAIGSRRENLALVAQGK
jgi:hypothetical protein